MPQSPPPTNRVRPPAAIGPYYDKVATRRQNLKLLKAIASIITQHRPQLIVGLEPEIDEAVFEHPKAKSWIRILQPGTNIDNIDVVLETQTVYIAIERRNIVASIYGPYHTGWGEHSKKQWAPADPNLIQELLNYIDKVMQT